MYKERVFYYTVKFVVYTVTPFSYGTVSLNSIYFQISIYTWQRTSIQIHGNWIRKQVT